jgi:hypothetical protein
MRWVEILRAEEDAIDWKILDWAGARDLWDEHYDKTKYFSVVTDILSKCSSVEVTSEQYDHGAPGRSGLEYTIETDNPKLLKKEIFAQIQIIIEPLLIERITPQAQVFTGEKDQIIGLLMMWASTARNLRLPAGYQGMAEANSRNLEVAAGEISAENYDKEKVAEILATLITKINSDSIKTKIKKIIRSLE